MADRADVNPTGRFSDRADDYVRYRPSYPSAAIDLILAGLPPPAELIAVDVGAGTGISSRLLAERGVRVMAVEPNQAMREAAEAHEGIDYFDGTAEEIPLAKGGADLVLVAQAFHWFRPDESLREMARVLRPGGRLALVWNRRSERDPFTSGYRQAILAVATDAKLEGMAADLSAIERSGCFGPQRFATFEQRQRLDRDGLVGRALSASYVPKEGPGRARLLELLESLFVAHAREGEVELVYDTEVTLAERLAERT